jgi:hypothetical protein
MENLVTDLTMGKPPPILHNLHLVAWRIFGGSTLQDLPSNTRDLHKAGWHPSTEDRYKRAWQSFKGHLCSSNVSLNQVGVKHVMNYLTHLHSLKLLYSTINLHRYAISMTLAHVDGAPISNHPLVTRLIKGAFTRRAPPRKVPSVWDPTPVMDIFMHWTLPLSCAQLVRKCAFILAVTSGRRLSELFALKCDDKHIQIYDDFVQLVPASLSKTDRVGHLGPPICLRSWREDSSICPVAIILALLEERALLDICHNRLFLNVRRPDSIMTLKTFRGCISRCLRDAGIEAPPGATPATVALRPLVEACVWVTSCWSTTSTFLRHYTAL